MARWRWLTGGRRAALAVLGVAGGFGSALPAAAQIEGVLEPLFALPLAVPEESAPPTLTTSDCQARLLLDCFVDHTVQTLTRLPADDTDEHPAWVPGPEPIPAPAVPALPVPPAPPVPAAPVAAAAPPPAEPAEFDQLRRAITAAGLDDTISVDIGATGGVLSVVLPEAD